MGGCCIMGCRGAIIVVTVSSRVGSCHVPLYPPKACPVPLTISSRGASLPGVRGGVCSCAVCGADGVVCSPVSGGTASPPGAGPDACPLSAAQDGDHTARRARAIMKEDVLFLTEESTVSALVVMQLPPVRFSFSQPDASS